MTSLIDSMDSGKKKLRKKPAKVVHKASAMSKLTALDFGPDVMSDVNSEIKSAYNESTRNLNFLASRPVPAIALNAALKRVGRYNDFTPRKAGDMIVKIDPFANILVGREGSVVLYIQPSDKSKADWLHASLSGYADEVGFVREAPSKSIGDSKYKPGSFLRVWWD